MYSNSNIPTIKWHAVWLPEGIAEMVGNRYLILEMKVMYSNNTIPTIKWHAVWLPKGIAEMVGIGTKFLNMK